MPTSAREGETLPPYPPLQIPPRPPPPPGCESEVQGVLRTHKLYANDPPHHHNGESKF